MELQYVLHLLAACVAGAVIGFERELHAKPAGFRTNIMICLGAALFTVVSIEMARSSIQADGDPRFADQTRIAAQIVTGVGFLGAGAIIQFRGNVIGLTTAATIWTVASVGMAFGAGQFVLGITATVLVTGVLFALSAAEHRIEAWRTTAKFHIRVSESLEVSDELKAIVTASGVECRTWKITKEPDGYTIYAKLGGAKAKLEKLQGKLVANRHVTSLARL